MSSYSDLVSDGGMDPRERKLIGYCEREEGFYPIYKAPRGSIVTQAFIICKYCRGTIDSVGGPKVDSVCIPCYNSVERREMHNDNTQ